MTFAQFVGTSTTGLIGILNTVIIPIIFALAFFVFVWGVISYFFFHSDDEKKRAEGRQFIFWGILGIVLLFSVWGFLNLLLSTQSLLRGA